MISDHAYARLSILLPARTLRALGRLNVPVYRITRGRLMNKVGRAPVMLLTTTGRHSGQPRTAPVVYGSDGERLIVISSNGGNRNAPGWSYNLKANPDAEVEIAGERRQVRARVLEGDERARVWRTMNELYRGFDDYDANVAREIAVFALEPAGA
ncbi:MAG TPA: nitroreductase family deazaflavin-dependent oxidoreductase [Solirubrobacteraceae bacterium]|nr:nitroreductase family deazaflavin-dependent oxidoreductase [Solirubrobacteraceae bacterium]